MSAFGDRFGRALSIAVALQLLLLTCFLPGLHTCVPRGTEGEFGQHRPGPGISGNHEEHDGTHDHESCPACRIQSESRGVPVTVVSGSTAPAPCEHRPVPAVDRPVPDRSLEKLLPRAPPSSLV